MAAGPSSLLAQVARRPFPAFHAKLTVTAAGTASVTFTAANYHKIYMFIASAKTHINTSTATVSHAWLPADVPQEFEPTPARPTIYIKGNGTSSSTVAISEVGTAK